ncbi:MAG: hypothetical protein KC636_17955 [Myxococcales bacterium]|nr:hypothetical protein [Myxococcales bacterium]
MESTSINVSNIILASLVGSTRSPEPTVDDLVLIRPEVFTHRALRTM